MQCQLDRLGDCHLQGDIRKVLRTLPSGLYETYDQILSDVDGKEFNRQIVKSTLRWLVGALHPLELPALAEAVTFDLENSGVFGEALFLPGEDVLKVCGSLVCFNRISYLNSDYVSLSHFSVKVRVCFEQTNAP